MKIARLNQKITIQKKIIQPDIYGNHISMWEDYFTCHAYLNEKEANSTAETEVVGNTVDKAVVSITVRFSKETASVTSTCFRIVFKNSTYNIISIDHMNYNNKSIKFRCRKERPE